MTEFMAMDAATLHQALELVTRYTGMTMVAAKQSMLQSRLRQRMRALQLDSYAAYLKLVESDLSERQYFIEVVTTHYTIFFRTQRVWRYVNEVFLPTWLERHEGEVLRAWSAAVSSGEEACTLAICCEEARRQHREFPYEITGTDIAADTIARASVGEYAGTSINVFRSTYPELFARYNHLGEAERFQLPVEMRNRIRYATHNLLEPSPWRARYDVILLRNVLIYFKKDDIQTIVRNVAQALRPGGVLIIGEAESLAAMDVPFQFVEPQIYRLVEPG